MVKPAVRGLAGLNGRLIAENASLKR